MSPVSAHKRAIEEKEQTMTNPSDFTPQPPQGSGPQPVQPTQPVPVQPAGNTVPPQTPGVIPIASGTPNTPNTPDAPNVRNKKTSKLAVFAIIVAAVFLLITFIGVNSWSLLAFFALLPVLLSGFAVYTTRKDGKAQGRVLAWVAVGITVVALIVGGVGLMLLLVMGGLQSCTAMFGSTGTGLAATSYLSEDSDMLGAEAAYAALEADLQHELDNYESLHPGYDEYRFDLDEIGHDPYVLTSILSALHEGVYTLGDVQGDLAMLFEKQYTLTQTIETETRYRTETRTDSEGNTYTVQVPYTYYICNVKLENFDMSHLPVYIMGEEQMSLYAVYMHTLGNRPDLFPNGTYPNASTVKEPTYYEIPPEALEDETFAAMIAEADKYVGYPYVWGGSSPSTSFDCSGFVCYVYTHSGVHNLPRTTAQGIYNQCAHIPMSEAKPGDIIFFTGTYNSPGPVSHVGIYVGNNMMIHCGNPIQYARTDSSYWSQHFYAIGRLN